MSVLPFLLEELSQPNMFKQPFGLGYTQSLMRPYQRPCRLSSAKQSGLSLIQNDKNNFKVNLDVQQFKPEEVSVKVVDGYIVVDGKHEERSDEHGYISRQFTRRYKVPDNVDPDVISSTLSSDGVLSIGAPKKIESAKGERQIRIVQTNEPSIKVSQDKEKGNGDKMEV